MYLFFSFKNIASKNAKMPIRPLIIIMIIKAFDASLNKALKETVPPFPTESPTVAKAEETSKNTHKKRVSCSKSDKINVQMII